MPATEAPASSSRWSATACRGSGSAPASQAGTPAPTANPATATTSFTATVRPASGPSAAPLTSGSPTSRQIRASGGLGVMAAHYRGPRPRAQAPSPHPAVALRLGGVSSGGCALSLEMTRCTASGEGPAAGSATSGCRDPETDRRVGSTPETSAAYRRKVPIGPVDPPPRLLMGPGPVNADPRA